MADTSSEFFRRVHQRVQLEVAMAVLGFHKMPPLTPRDRVVYPWLIAYRGGARRPLWQPTSGGTYRVIVPKWVKVPKETKETKDDPGLQSTSEDPNA